MGFHVELGRACSPQQNRAEKRELVRSGATHNALVLDGDTCPGRCQFGGPHELPEITSRRRHERELTRLPDWRITCFFTGKGLRRRGVADIALGGAPDEIARLGGGVVEGYPEETGDRAVPGAYLHTGPISPRRWVVTRTVDGTSAARPQGVTHSRRRPDTTNAAPHPVPAGEGPRPVEL
ncbi:hypothetical protein [Pseudonocardia alni]|uniref:hypothetical protein n=1 Tax=Pseudonocardia alni TaxID=33907 RepID=UPI001AD66364|nr:hypothetical protein [Pseudonocardia alni]